ncbi:MAG: D-hexose-6-phosphate mutarotase [Armatimonadota bacterium]
MIEKLQVEYGFGGALTFVPGTNGLLKAVLVHRSGARVEVYLHGAHVTSWRNAAGDELFFLSRESNFAPERPIRGGIPVIFPQFGGGSLPSHGIARISEWSVAHTGVLDNGDILLALQLHQSAESLELWPYRFSLTLGIALAADSLTISLDAENMDEKAFSFTSALHTYFGVADIGRTALRGLQDVAYIDSLREDIQEVETRPVIRLAEETDRIYVDAPDHLYVDDEGHGRTIEITKAGMPDVVVWNPWIAKSQRMPDFGDDEYLRMVCVETGIIAAPRDLSPGEYWQGTTRFSTA